MTSRGNKRKRTLEQRHRNKDVKNTSAVPDTKQQTLALTPSTFSFAELCREVKTKVYSITRIRQIDEKGSANFTTLGTGFLAGHGRLLTCAHVMANKDQEHKEGDRYLFIQQDEYGNYHRDVVALELDKTLFVYPDIDASVIYLPEAFYMQGEQYIRDPEEYLRLSGMNHPIGTEVGVFGYPLQQVIVANNEVNMSDISIRVDRGVLNSGRKVNDVIVNEFTMAFNPGNSGGPIIDCSTGAVIAYVESYTSMPIKFAKETIPPELRKEMGTDHTITAIRALYSRGFCTTNLKAIAGKHGLKLG